MSYDLSIEAGPGKKLDRKSFAAYFRSRPNYQVENGQALYQNEGTGVYFIFDEPEEGVVMFNLNYFRPHVFGLEAAIELERLGEALNARFGDPQGEMNGAFSRDAFLRGWNYGNRFAVRSMLAEQGPVHSWPGKRIRQVWEWNYARGVERQMDEDVIFAPTIFAVM